MLIEICQWWKLVFKKQNPVKRKIVEPPLPHLIQHIPNFFELDWNTPVAFPDFIFTALLNSQVNYVIIRIPILEGTFADGHRYSIDLSIEKEASKWLNTLPLQRNHFDLLKTKTEISDGIVLRYRKEPLNMPPMCRCGKVSSVSHSPQNTKGGYAQMRQRKPRHVHCCYEKSLLW